MERPFPPEQEDYLRHKVKAQLRKRMRSVRAAIPESACLSRSRQIIERLLGLEATQQALRVALFWPIRERREVDLAALFDVLVADGKCVYFPSISVPEDDVEADALAPVALARRERVMTFRRVRHVAELEERGLGFAEPPLTAEEAAELDFIVVPALAVDGSGHRIGYGAGFYDRALPRFAPPARTAVVAFDFQLIAEVPVTSGDVPLDYVVTDERVVARSES